MARTDPPSKHTVALFISNADTCEMVLHMLHALGYDAIVGCPIAELRSNPVNFARYLIKFEPQVVIFDIGPPYQENWHLFGPLFHDEAIEGRGLVVTTPNKLALDHAMGKQSGSIEMLGRPYAANEIENAIEAAVKRGQTPRSTLAINALLVSFRSPENMPTSDQLPVLGGRMVTPKPREPQWRTPLDISSIPAIAHLPALVPIERRNVAARYALMRRVYREFEDKPGLSVTTGQAASCLD